MATPDEQAALLLELGDWLARNGEAIYGTRPWTRAEGRTACGLEVRFTRSGERLYATLLGTPQGKELRLENVPVADGAGIRLLGHGAVDWRRDGRSVVIALARPPDESAAHVFEITPAPGAPSARFRPVPSR